MNKEEIKKEFEDSVIGGVFAGGTFNDNNNQKMYTEGYKDGFEKAKEISWNFFEPIITQVERDKEEETAKDIALMCRVLLTKKDGDFIANEIERIYLTSSKKEQNE